MARKLGFIGLGNMGRPMVENLLAAGHAVSVFDIRKEAMEALVANGALGASSPQGVAEGSEVLFSSLPTPEVVEEVYLGEKGVISGTKAGSIAVELSTIDPATHRRIALRLKEKGMEYLDASVSGGPWGAKQGTLSIMVGGDEAAFAEVKPLFEVLGKSIYYMGPVGAGATVKLVNQLMLAINRCAIFEALALGVKAGLDPQKMVEVVSASTGGSRTLEHAKGKILAGDFQPDFTLDYMYKDLALSLKMGQAEGVRLLMGGLALQVFQEARAMGLGPLDFSAGIIPMEKLTGVEVRRPK